MPEILIGRGKTARVYKIDGVTQLLSRKEFSPIHHVKLWNWFLYNSPHPLATETGHKYAYWKRRLAHRLCKFLDSKIHIPDAMRLAPKGFTLKYIEGRRPKIRERRKLYAATKKLENFFNKIGMPTWSFSRKNPFSHSNFIFKGDTIYIIDYEQSVPVPDSRRNIGYDAIYFNETDKFITDKRQLILDKLGVEETENLIKAFESTKECYKELDIRPKTITRFINSVRKMSYKGHK